MPEIHGETTHDDTTLPWIDTLALVIVAALVTAPDLGTPAAPVFDEVYYVSDALATLDHGVAAGFQAHPPLGTLLIAAGIAVGGPGPVGWRLAPLLTGLLTVVAIHRLSGHLFGGRPRTRLLAALTAAFVIVDPSWSVLTRTAMLDGPLTTMVAVAAACGAAAAAAPPHRRTWWLVAAGAAAGAATAVKLSGAAALVIVLVVAATVGRRGDLRSTLKAAPAMLLGAAVVYAASWVPFVVFRDDVALVSCPSLAEPCPDDGGVRGVVAQHGMFFRYHAALEPDSTETSSPSLWPALVRPVGLYRSDCGPRSPAPDILAAPTDCADVPWPEDVDTIRYTGNPITWLAFLALLPVLAAAARNGDVAARVALACWGLLWLPWLVTSRPGYLFYLAPAVPFIALGTVAAGLAASRGGIVRPLLAGTVGAAIGLAVAAATPLPLALAIMAAAVGGAWFRPTPPPGGPAPPWVVVGLFLTATVAFGVLWPMLTASAGN